MDQEKEEEFKREQENFKDQEKGVKGEIIPLPFEIIFKILTYVWENKFENNNSYLDNNKYELRFLSKAIYNEYSIYFRRQFIKLLIYIYPEQFNEQIANEFLHLLKKNNAYISGSVILSVIYNTYHLSNPDKSFNDIDIYIVNPLDEPNLHQFDNLGDNNYGNELYPVAYEYVEPYFKELNKFLTNIGFNYRPNVVEEDRYIDMRIIEPDKDGNEIYNIMHIRDYKCNKYNVGSINGEDVSPYRIQLINNLLYKKDPNNPRASIGSVNYNRKNHIESIIDKYDISICKNYFDGFGLYVKHHDHIKHKWFDINQNLIEKNYNNPIIRKYIYRLNKYVYIKGFIGFNNTPNEDKPQMLLKVNDLLRYGIIDFTDITLKNELHIHRMCKYDQIFYNHNYLNILHHSYFENNNIVKNIIFKQIRDNKKMILI